jgi:hypothetical protein
MLPAYSVSTAIFLLCAGETSTLYASGVSSCTWEPGGLTGTAVVVSPTVSTTYTAYGSNGGCIGNVTIMQAVSACNGVEEHGINELLSIAPNPSSGWVRIISAAKEHVKLVLYDIDGRKISEQFVLPEEELNISDLNSGVYLLEFGAGVSKTYKKLVVLR